VIDQTSQIDRIKAILGRLGIEVREELLGGTGGGLCNVRGRRMFVLDREADAATRLDRCLAALLAVPEAETIYLPPDLREAIDGRRP